MVSIQNVARGPNVFRVRWQDNLGQVRLQLCIVANCPEQTGAHVRPVRTPPATDHALGSLDVPIRHDALGWILYSTESGLIHVDEYE